MPRLARILILALLAVAVVSVALLIYVVLTVS